MSINRNIAFLVGTSLVLGAISTSALAQGKKTNMTATRDVRQLVRMMDRDKNGTVSKEEFMDFMSRTFDRLDVNKSGQLEPQELHRLTTPSWPGPPLEPGSAE